MYWAPNGESPSGLPSVARADSVERRRSGGLEASQGSRAAGLLLVNRRVGFASAPLIKSGAHQYDAKHQSAAADDRRDDIGFLLGGLHVERADFRDVLSVLRGEDRNREGDDPGEDQHRAGDQQRAHARATHSEPPSTKSWPATRSRPGVNPAIAGSTGPDNGPGSFVIAIIERVPLRRRAKEGAERPSRCRAPRRLGGAHMWGSRSSRRRHR